MYAVIRNYENEAPDAADQVRAQAAGLTELIRGIDGFLAYYLLDVGEGRVATVSVFTERAGAEESTRAVAKWLQDAGLGAAIPHPPTVVQGTVTIDATR